MLHPWKPFTCSNIFLENSRQDFLRNSCNWSELHKSTNQGREIEICIKVKKIDIEMKACCLKRTAFSLACLVFCELFVEEEVSHPHQCRS